MKADFYLTAEGDLAVSNQGDVAITPTQQEQIEQQCRMRLATQRLDFVVYPQIGTDLQRMIGMPNTKATALFGRKLIDRGLSYDGFVPRGRIKIEGYPSNIDTIVYDVGIPWGTREYINIRIEQILVL